MTAIELYIDQQLCDIDNAENFSVYLKRQLLNPAELSTKDAQRSYDITLPASATNNKIFGYINTEEVSGKFTNIYDAVMYIGSVKVFDGKFKLTKITADSYTGNLGIPAKKTAKDIFGEKMMNQGGEWNIDFWSSSDMTKYNTGTYNKQKYGQISPCFFPFVLYGLIYKYPVNGIYSNKDVLDSSTLFSIHDFPPSVNCIQMLQKLFENHKYSLGGSALSDERINKLYVSYKNPDDYPMAWSSGQMQLQGSWVNFIFDTNKKLSETRYSLIKPDTYVYAIDLFDSDFSKINIIENGGSMASQNAENNTLNITIPNSGLYKITFSCKLSLNTTRGGFIHDYNNTPFVYPMSNDGTDNTLSTKRYEIKLMRNIKSLNDLRQDNVFFRDNKDQGIEDTKTTAIFPDAHGVNFIDPKQSKDILCGFSWGITTTSPQYINPLCEGLQYNLMALTGGKSWDENEYPDYMGYSASESTGYKKWDGSKWADTDEFRIPIINIPNENKNRIDWNDTSTYSNGTISQIVWLNEGDSLNLIEMSDAGYYENRKGWIRHDVNFDLTITPFRKDKSWLRIQPNGSCADGVELDWTESNITAGLINLIDFLPSEVTINDWIDNFCKAFNLSLVQTGDTKFELNTKSIRSIDNMSDIINIDNRVSIKQKVNTPLGLPSSYELGFKVETDEEGYVKSMKEVDGKLVAQDGRGVFVTKSYSDNKLTQESDFSYNWYKELYTPSDVISVPVISDKEVWENGSEDYEEMIDKRYTDLAQRFWYCPGNVYEVNIGDRALNKTIKAALVSNEYNGLNKQILDYEDKPYSIMKNYFLLLADADNHYTTVECYLTPGEYSNIDNSLIQFNGDLYYVAEVDGYDPLGQKNTALKLIRKTL